jgi:prefoldin subunit 5
VDELVKSRDDLQTMVTSLVDTRGTLEKQVAALTKSRNAAMIDAKSAQAKVDALSDRLKSQTQQMIELQEQMTSVRAVLQQLQQKLE